MSDNWMRKPFSPFKRPLRSESGNTSGHSAQQPKPPRSTTYPNRRTMIHRGIHVAESCRSHPPPSPSSGSLYLQTLPIWLSDRVTENEIGSARGAWMLLRFAVWADGLTVKVRQESQQGQHFYPPSPKSGLADWMRLHVDSMNWCFPVLFLRGEWEHDARRCHLSGACSCAENWVLRKSFEGKS